MLMQLMMKQANQISPQSIGAGRSSPQWQVSLCNPDFWHVLAKMRKRTEYQKTAMKLLVENYENYLSPVSLGCLLWGCSIGWSAVALPKMRKLVSN